MIEVGEYIRTKEGEIGKLTKTTEEPEVDIGIAIMPEVTAYWLNQHTYVEETDITKHSKNIIDLIEIGDYVNGLVINLILDGKVYHDAHDMLDVYMFEEKDIKTILTHEMYEQNCYKIGDYDE